MVEVVADDGRRDTRRVVGQLEGREERTGGRPCEDLRIGPDDPDNEQDADDEVNDERDHAVSMV
jgi:hypothetical protein